MIETVFNWSVGSREPIIRMVQPKKRDPMKTYPMKMRVTPESRDFFYSPPGTSDLKRPTQVVSNGKPYTLMMGSKMHAQLTAALHMERRSYFGKHRDRVGFPLLNQQLEAYVQHDLVEASLATDRAEMAKRCNPSTRYPYEIETLV